MNSIYIYGASGHGLVVADIARACGYTEIIFIDDGENTYLSFDEIRMKTDIPLAFGIGLNSTRKSLFDKLSKLNFQLIPLIHPSAVISPSASVGMGTVIMPGVIVNAEAEIGNGVILNTAAIVEHENKIGDFAHISPNVALAGNVTIDENTHIGIGTCVREGICIGKNCLIGAGSVVVANIDNNQIGFGNPCKIQGERDA
jgi:UDP-N-acetylbacillosamine N-acetyltransferase